MSKDTLPKTDIAAAKERPDKMIARKQDCENDSLQRNRKAIMTFLRSEKLHKVPVETWAAALPELRKILGMK